MEAATVTVQYRPVCRQETVLQSLLVIARLECLLLRDDIVEMFAGKEGNFVAAMAIEDSKKGKLVRVCLRRLGIVGEQVEYRGVGVFHADTPALHGRDAIEQSVILASC